MVNQLPVETIEYLQCDSLIFLLSITHPVFKSYKSLKDVVNRTRVRLFNKSDSIDDNSYRSFKSQHPVRIAFSTFTLKINIMLQSAETMGINGFDSEEDYDD